jgi:hypothetical protein
MRDVLLVFLHKGNLIIQQDMPVIKQIDILYSESLDLLTIRYTVIKSKNLHTLWKST